MKTPASIAATLEKVLIAARGVLRTTAFVLVFLGDSGSMSSSSMSELVLQTMLWVWTLYHWMLDVHFIYFYQKRDDPAAINRQLVISSRSGTWLIFNATRELDTAEIPSCSTQINSWCKDTVLLVMKLQVYRTWVGFVLNCMTQLFLHATNTNIKNRRFNQALNNVACWGYWDTTSSYMLGTTCQNAIWVKALEDASGWAWFIPLHDGSTSQSYG
ncbi:uncharacterized protein EDB91DRAFT_1085410 [Suillus paluster]|uniref:uncharacterized protein n=1 Tax=Suillus paluster TaxID=48578 RepID=UPI001B880436|nr:uncharacterized protein EDB91DRAFT_1085410 [Suillus paluster]KAG1730536.1 hypothetical protein EDB91DRAFT_1085410 [Suillus paluster]